jgi:multicomponent Na+:H+ antiporter subunit D
MPEWISASLLLWPLIIPLGAAALCAIFWSAPRVQGWIATASLTVMMLTSLFLLAQVVENGIQAKQFGSWAPPFGVSFVADLFSAAMVVISSLLALAVAVFGLADLNDIQKRAGFYPLFMGLMVGVNGAFLTGDLFNLYVWFEVMLISSFVLLALGGEHAQLEGSIKYVTLNLISSALFLAAVGILYGMTGTLNMADLSTKLAKVPHTTSVTATSLLFLVAFGIKAAVFPLFFWLPASYHTPPAATSALFAGLLTKVGVYALIRFFTLLFTHDTAYTHTLILWIAGLTMVTGVLGAAAQSELRRILSFHIVSQIGYMVMGLALFAPLALAGSVFYIAHHILVKTNLFLVSGVVREVGGSYELDELGGLYRARPALALVFLIPALSLAGMPPLSGFFAKLTLVQAGVALERYAIVIAALGTSLLTLFSMTKIWAEVFWKAPPERSVHASAVGVPLGGKRTLVLMLPIAALSALTVGIGLWPGPLLSLAMSAAEQLLDPAPYVRAVMEARR